MPFFLYCEEISTKLSLGRRRPVVVVRPVGDSWKAIGREAVPFAESSMKPRHKVGHI
jgi:hypothetical protein